MTTVVDYSFARPGAPAILAGGHVGAIRYLGDDHPRCITADELQHLRDAGLQVGLVWETTEHRTLDGAGAGIDDARKANAHADALGFPAHRPLYFAVDFEPTQEQLTGPIRSYFLACKDASARPIRPYGCARVIDYLCGTVGISDCGWQCVAWSYGNVSAFTAMLQHFPPIMEGACDLDTIFMADYGQWDGPDGSFVAPMAMRVPQVLEGTVNEVQTLLTIISRDNGDASMDPGGVDGIWGPATEAAVVAFQQKATTPLGDPVGVDGVVGKETMTAMRILAFVVLSANQPMSAAVPFPGGLYGAPELNPGVTLTGDAGVIQQIQRRLCELGLPVGPAGADGIFGLDTTRGVRFFQTQHGLDADGLVGEMTWKALFG